MEGGSCVVILEESSTWTVLPQRSCEDRSGLYHHAQLSEVTATSVDSDRLAHGRQVAGCKVMQTVEH